MPPNGGTPAPRSGAPALLTMQVVSDGQGPLFNLAPELAIDTDVARRVVTEFIRGQLRQAGFERALLGLSGGIDSALVAYLLAEAIGPQNLMCISMPYAMSSSGSLTDAGDVVRRLGCSMDCCKKTFKRRLFLPIGLNPNPCAPGGFAP